MILFPGSKGFLVSMIFAGCIVISSISYARQKNLGEIKKYEKAFTKVSESLEMNNQKEIQGLE